MSRLAPRRRSRVLAVQAIRRSPAKRDRNRGRRWRDDLRIAVRAEVYAPGRQPDPVALERFAQIRISLRSAHGLDLEDGGAL